MTTKIDTVYLDMDGVVADFSLGVAKLFFAGDAAKKMAYTTDAYGLDTFPPAWTSVYGVRHDDDVWKLVEQAGGPRWWLNLGYLSGRFPDAPYPADFVVATRHCGIPNINILSALPRKFAHSACLGKSAWLDEHMPPTVPRCFVNRSDKCRFAAASTLLIDDHHLTVREFVDNGGSAIRFRPCSMDDLMGYIRRVLDGERLVVI